VKKAYWAMFDMPDDVQPGPRAESLAQQRIDAFAATYAKTYPAAVRCLLDDRQALTAYLHFPAEHWHRIRHSNFIERTFGETRRRVKVIGRLPGETSCVSLVWAVLDRASRGWRGFTVTTAGTRLLHDLRRQLLDPPTPIRRHTRKVHQPAADAA
jgi:putative transposase